jgi:glycosyltransferase involved in cell wall biosynthesis
MNDEEIQILFPAAFWEHKNHFLLFKSLALVDPSLRFTVHLTGYQFGKEEKYKELILNNSNQTINFHGVVSEVELINLYSKSNIVLSCSLYESSSQPLLEGAAAGCILLASDIAAHREMSTSINLLLFNPTDPLSLADLLENVAQNKIERDAIIYSNHRAIAGYDWSIISLRYWAIFEKVVNRADD